ncbi:LCP family protein [Brevibacillus sp. B_LB10_24]|uniref:LCP family protein n=1 Tax=Brevibacillus sp. B_LB10_24 TaxID=3380645 RepID=UPI0038BC0CD1
MQIKLRWIALSLAIPILLIMGYYGYAFFHFAIQISNPDVRNVIDLQPAEKEPLTNQIPEWEGDERVNILLLGGDGRSDDDPGRTDTMLLVSIDPVTKKIHVFSILRDTYVNIPDHGSQKINAAFAYGGPELSMKTVSELVGLPIHYYFYVDLESFIKLVDSIGGVDLYVEKNMKYTDPSDKPEYQINLKEGMQHLDGNKALQYVRFRHDAMSDYTRTERQRKFLMAVGKKLQTTSSLVALPNILNEIAPYIETNLDLKNMLKLAVLCYKVQTDSIVTAQLPPMELLKEETIKGAAVLVADPGKLKEYVAKQLAGSSE